MEYDGSIMRRAFWVITALAIGCGSAETEPDRFGDDDDATSAQAGPTTGVGGVATTGGTGAMTTAGGAPTTSSGSSPVTTSSSSSGTTCNDPGPEPNNTMGAASYLGAIDDCDSSGLAFSGVLANNDVDWFSYDGSDVTFCSVNPSRTITADTQVRLCKYPTCVSGTPEFTCPAGTSPDNVDGVDGCCSTSEVSFGFGCGGFGQVSDDAEVYLRIDKPSGIDCVSYSVSFHY